MASKHIWEMFRILQNRVDTQSQSPQTKVEDNKSPPAPQYVLPDGQLVADNSPLEPRIVLECESDTQLALHTEVSALPTDDKPALKALLRSPCSMAHKTLPATKIMTNRSSQLPISSHRYVDRKDMKVSPFRSVTPERTDLLMWTTGPLPNSPANSSKLSNTVEGGFYDLVEIHDSSETSMLPEGAQVIYQEPIENQSERISPERTKSPHSDHGSYLNYEEIDPTDQNTDSQSRKRRRYPGTESSQTPVRKRMRNHTMSMKNLRKVKVNSGQEYISARGKPMPCRTMRPACSCKFDCLHRIPEERRDEAFRVFWSLADHDRQWEFIRAHSESKATHSSKGIKRCHRTYYLDDQKVCKKMFMSTLSIWDSWIDSAYSHVNSSKGQTSTPDKRGRHSNHPIKITEEKIRTVQEHVGKFPRVPSHYCRKRTKKEYLENGLSLKKMSKDYLSWAQSQNLPPAAVANTRQYIDIVNSHFNLGFYLPKKDQCKLCSLMQNKHNTQEVKEKFKEQWIGHIKNKDLVRKINDKEKAAAEKNRTIALCSFDLQKQLSCPKSDASPFYYASKLNIYNFTIFHSIKRLGFCYLWHEGIAKKGSDEIASSLFNFITKLVADGYKEIIFYSDNCAGQNKNRFIFSMFELAAVKYCIKITHRFLEPGHTMMEVDSIHARIERSTAGKEILDFEDWVKAIENAKEEFPKYNVVKFTNNFVKSFKPLVNMQNWERDVNGNKIFWKKVKEVTINGSESNLIQIKYGYEGDVITLCPNKPGRPVNLINYCPPIAYNTKIPLSENTVRDLTYLCNSMAIPVSKHPFYKAVLAGCNPTDNGDMTEPEHETDEETCMGETLEEENRVCT